MAPSDQPASLQLCTCTVVPDRERVRLVVAGELDIAEVPVVDEHLADLRAAGFDRIELDLREASFVDSQGVALAAAWRVRAARDGFELAVLPVPDPRIAALLDVADELAASVVRG